MTEITSRPRLRFSHRSHEAPTDDQSRVAGRSAAVAVKRLIDVVGAAAALVVLAPLFALVAVVVAIVDGRPVLFRQRRVGRDGAALTIWKFRTMVHDAEGRLGEVAPRNEVRGPGFKLTDDPRLTRTGRFLRRSSLDELPQLWNILGGEMSLVGPRPALPAEVAAYEPWQRRRLCVKPGLTGLWQVSARNDDDVDRWVRLDLAYIDGWSLRLDVTILARTLPAVLAFDGR